MSPFEYLIELSIFFLASLAVLYCMRKVGYSIGLTDKPDAREHHEGVVPLVGGISLCITLLYFLYVNAEQFNNLEIPATCIVVLVLVGVAGDRFDICFKLRMGVQAILAMVIMHYTGLTLSHVGNVFGFGVLDFPVMLDSVINVFNMVDSIGGIDGLMGVLSISVFTSLGGAPLMGSSFIPFYGVYGEHVIPFFLFYTIVAYLSFHTYAMTHSFKMAKIVRELKKLDETAVLLGDEV
ncbi:Undecaprenyl-phosphate N-acetylglucosaminyl 1-phosphate transferase [Vibrio chagasii]|nr:Undecaprenyl-phosphate N-acetylglucosaminyl 1-phosphate transferase [Vibrio chagasii]CAH6906778.1 Undecaprenyl-phosphate N-acetylglucosaminyl 1-phosphate transferase [Vibrio chagasii]